MAWEIPPLPRLVSHRLPSIDGISGFLQDPSELLRLIANNVVGTFDASSLRLQFDHEPLWFPRSQSMGMRVDKRRGSVTIFPDQSFGSPSHFRLAFRVLRCGDEHPLSGRLRYGDIVVASAPDARDQGEFSSGSPSRHAPSLGRCGRRGFLLKGRPTFPDLSYRSYERHKSPKELSANHTKREHREEPIADERPDHEDAPKNREHDPADVSDDGDGIAGAPGLLPRAGPVELRELCHGTVSTCEREPQCL